MTDWVSHLPDEATHGLGSLEIHHPPGTFALTPASRIAVDAVGRHKGRFEGTGLDWGSGSGVLAILLGRIPAVEQVIGLELEPLNVEISKANARRNAVGHKVRFFQSDSYSPVTAEGRRALEAVEGGIDFVVANPPSSSPVDDGFGFRRAVVQGVGRYLKPGGVLCLSVSRQYGTSRLMGLLDLDPRLEYAGVLSSTAWVEFDMTRDDLRADVHAYAAEEEKGGLRYSFRHPEFMGRDMTALEALAHFEKTGASPKSQWQSHLFVRDG